MDGYNTHTIEAARYGRHETRVVCVCCGGEAIGSSACCTRCHIPLEVSRCAEFRNTKPNFIPVLGASGAGKTVYIGLLLDLLTKGKHGVSGLPANAFSVAVQHETMSALERRRFPEKTTSEAEDWQWVHCEVAADSKGKRFADIVTPDLAGESIAAELDYPGTYPAVRSCVEMAGAFIVLLDSVRARDGGSAEDLFATRLVAYIRQHARGCGTANKRLQQPLAVTFTKTDECPEAEGCPIEFAKNNLPNLVPYCTRHFAKTGYFAASAVGGVAKVVDEHQDTWYLPLHVQPRGITAPLAWALHA